MNIASNQADAALVISELRHQLQEALDTLEAIRSGDVDALLVGNPNGTEVFTLRNADRPYRFLIEQMSEGAMTMTQDGVIVYGNSRVADIFGAPLEQVVGTSLQLYLSEPDFNSVMSATRAGVAESPRIEVVILRREGAPACVMVSINEITSDTPGLRLFGAVVTDLTESRKVEERLRHAQKMEAVGQLTGGLAHDFNNLLQAVCGNLQLIKLKPNDSARVVMWAQRAHDAAMRGAKLTTQLLAFSRLEQVNVEPVDLPELILGMGDLFQHTLGPSIEVAYHLDQGNSHVLADKTQLELALLNLAINARDAMPAGGVLTIRQECAVDVPDGESEKWMCVSVSDTGTGMPADVVARAFDPFFTTKAVGQGTGLGLAQVYGIARQAGGAATIKSVEGVGTTVSIMLRRTSAAQKDSVDSSATMRMPNAANATRVIVVDDDDDVRSFLVESLHLLGYSVTAAGDGLEALEMVKASPPDLMIVDYAMPKLNGSEFVRAARQAGIDVPVIFASGYFNQTELSNLLDAKTAVLMKPFSLPTLKELLDRILRNTGH